MAERVEHWFNRRWRMARRDVYLLRTETGWQVLGRERDSAGREVAYYFGDEKDARAMVGAMKEKVPPELSNWAQATERRPSHLRSGLRSGSGAASRQQADADVSFEMRRI